MILDTVFPKRESNGERNKIPTSGNTGQEWGTRPMDSRD